MSSRVLEQGPLALYVEKFFHTQGEGVKYSRGLNNWLRLLDVVQSHPPDPRKANFVDNLSGSQALSGILLSEWWNAWTEKSIFIKDIKGIIGGGALQEKLAGKAVLDPELIQSLLQRRKEIDRYKYHEELLMLWQAEFLSCYQTIDDQYITTLQRHRHDAALVASCQRTFWKVFGHRQEDVDPPVPSIPDHSAGISTPLEGRCKATKKYRAWGMSWVTEPCPWLRLRANAIANIGTMQDLPYYLWDVQEGRTVKTEDLGQRPEYIVVSHTWGRWRKKLPSVKVQGVPWFVPQNCRFEVTELPQILRTMDIIAPYVWMDLVCIPQNKSDPMQAQMRNVEVGRQSRIFGSAKAGAIWLNDVDSWNGIETAVRWFCLKYFAASRPDVDEAFKSQLHSVAELASSSIGAFAPGGGLGMDTKDPGHLGWFSSLWTLQEACMRPQMGFLNRWGKGLFIGDDIMTMDAVLALVRWVSLDLTVRFPASIPSSEIPKGPSELIQLCESFQMTDLLNINPVQLLGMANQRYCEHSRAQAIMSVIGTTDWWNQHLATHSQPPPETDHVLGRFPLAFVNEIREQLKAAFFGSVSLSVDTLDLGLPGGTGTRFGYTVIGSMMPFSSAPERQRGSYVWSGEFTDHPSVNDWRICPDGCVEIDEAGIVAANVDRAIIGLREENLAAAIFAPKGHTAGSPLTKQCVDLNHWLAEFRPGAKIYAVCLCYGGPKGGDWGVILQQIPMWNRDPPATTKLGTDLQLLVKIGAYILKGERPTREPRTQKVKWLVL